MLRFGIVVFPGSNCDHDCFHTVKHVLGHEAEFIWHEKTELSGFDCVIIPIAEETDLIIPLGEWALTTALTFLNRLAKGGYHGLNMAINISPVQFKQPNLADTLLSIIKKSGIPPEQVELELTESTLMMNIQDSMAMLHRFKAQGVQLAIDDFGTGFSSFSYLKKLPVDKLKIDRSFIQDLGKNLEDKNIIHAIIALAKSLQLTVIAEGVEREEQRVLLKEMGCQWVQGYLCSKPLPAEDCLAFLKHFNAEENT